MYEFFEHPTKEKERREREREKEEKRKSIKIHDDFFGITLVEPRKEKGRNERKDGERRGERRKGGETGGKEGGEVGGGGDAGGDRKVELKRGKLKKKSLFLYYYFFFFLYFGVFPFHKSSPFFSFSAVDEKEKEAIRTAVLQQLLEIEPYMDLFLDFLGEIEVEWVGKVLIELDELLKEEELDGIFFFSIFLLFYFFLFILFLKKKNRESPSSNSIKIYYCHPQRIYFCSCDLNQKME